MRLNPRFYSHPSRELMRLKKGLIKIWGDLAKKTKQSIKQAQKKKTNRLCTRRKSVLMMGVAMGKGQKYIFVR